MEMERPGADKGCQTNRGQSMVFDPPFCKILVPVPGWKGVRVRILCTVWVIIGGFVHESGVLVAISVF